MITEYESLLHKLISRNLVAERFELPDGYVALFASGSSEAPSYAYLFRSNGHEAAAPLISFSDNADFTAWIDGLRKAVEGGLGTVEEYWRQRAEIIGQADKNRQTRKTVTERVHGEIDALIELQVFTAARGQKLKASLTPSVIARHVQDGMTTRDIIEAHIRESPQEKFANDVLACVDELNTALRGLAAGYEDLVIIAALAEHVGGALRIFMDNGICNSQQARRVLKHLDDTAFSRAESELARSIDDSTTRVEMPFRLAIGLNPYLTTPVVVERDLTEEEALTFLGSMWEGLEAEGDPTRERLVEFLARVSADSREALALCEEKFGFELYRSASCHPPTVRLVPPNVPREHDGDHPQ